MPKVLMLVTVEIADEKSLREYVGSSLAGWFGLKLNIEEVNDLP